MQLTGLLRLINYNFFSKYKLKKYPIFTGQKLGQVTLFSVMSCPEGTKIFKCMSCPVREIKNICPILKIQDRTGIALAPFSPSQLPAVFMIDAQNTNRVHNKTNEYYLISQKLLVLNVRNNVKVKKNRYHGNVDKR